MTNQLTHEQLVELQEFVELTNDEWSEAMENLLSLRRSIAISDEFQTALEKELFDAYTWVKENLEIVERTETIIRKFREVVDREFDEDSK